MTEQLDKVTFEARDEYQRKPIAEKVITLLTSDSQVSPMIIDGGWGTGKTEFCHKLIHLIENGDFGIEAVYVDAFKADHADEPLMTLLAAILKLLPENERPNLIEKALPAVKFGLKTTLKAGVSWLLKQDATDLADDFDDDIKKASDEAINHSVESLIKDHVVAEESIDTLKLALNEITSNSPIVIFVDELDRCRPDFAVAMLESIKHIFDVDGVEFVLITNSTQLRASINHCYGDKVVAQRYLDKFIGFSFTLPQTHKPDGYMAVLASISHLRALINNSGLLNNAYLSIPVRQGFLDLLVKENQLSLREVETFVRHLEIYQALTQNNTEGGEGGFSENLISGYALFRILGVYLFTFKPDHANDLVRGIINADETASVLGKTKLFELTDSHYPDNADIMMAIIASETIEGAESYWRLSDESISDFWNPQINHLFNGGVHRPREGEITKIISKTIEVLKLGE